MGMYSYHRDDDVEIIDLEGLKKFLKDIEEGNIKEYKEFPNIKHYAKALEIKYNERRKISHLSFQGWDGWKIISYWYEEMCVLLRDLAVFCEGTVEFDFENDDEAGKWEFEEGECKIHTGQMQWQEWEATDQINKDKKIPDYVKERLMLRKL